MFREAKVGEQFCESEVRGNCGLQGTDVSEEISRYTLKVFIILQIFFATRVSFENWGIHISC